MLTRCGSDECFAQPTLDACQHSVARTAVLTVQILVPVLFQVWISVRQRGERKKRRGERETRFQGNGPAKECRAATVSCSHYSLIWLILVWMPKWAKTAVTSDIRCDLVVISIRGKKNMSYYIYGNSCQEYVFRETPRSGIIKAVCDCFHTPPLLSPI